MSSWTIVVDDVFTLMGTVSGIGQGKKVGVKQFEDLNFPAYMVEPIEDSSEADEIGTTGNNQEIFLVRVTIVNEFKDPDTDDITMRTLVDAARKVIRDNPQLNDPSNICWANLIKGVWGYTTDTQYRLYQMDIEATTLVNRA